MIDQAALASETAVADIEKEYRIIGPPGTGKTREISRQVARAVDAGRRPLITSLTRSAAYEIGSRIDADPWKFTSEQVGTLHSHCFRALGTPQLISKGAHVDDWNNYIKKHNPAWELSLTVFNEKADEATLKSAMGDRTFKVYNLLRARMTPLDLWPTEIRSFATKFREWQAASNLLDFTDLIEQCLEKRIPPPFSPDTIFVDEAQDHDRMELALVRMWSQNADRLVVVGDPDQNLYQFRGAEPEAFYDHEIPASHTKILAQSYRVPRAVHAAAMGMLSLIQDRRVVEYLPRPEPGLCRRLYLNSRKSHEVIDFAQRLTEKKNADGKQQTVMLLASCDYMLGSLIKFMRDAGIPFHNPFAPNRGQFNPLGDIRSRSPNRTTSAARLLAFLRSSEQHCKDARLWTWAEFAAWIDPLNAAGFLKRGAKTKLEQLAAKRGEQTVDNATLRELLDGENGLAELRRIESNPVAWFNERLNKSRAPAFEFPINVVNRRGAAALTEEPNLMIGTVHSVKGGEADAVILFPDLSPQGMETLSHDPAAVYRMFYVGMTRARSELHLAQNASGMALKWPE